MWQLRGEPRSPPLEFVLFLPVKKSASLPSDKTHSNSPKTHTKLTQDSHQTHPKLTQNSPKTHPNSPKLTQNSTKTHPKLTQNSPVSCELTRDSPKLTQTHPKLTPNSPKTHPKLTQDSPKLTQNYNIFRFRPGPQKTAPEALKIEYH